MCKGGGQDGEQDGGEGEQRAETCFLSFLSIFDLKLIFVSYPLQSKLNFVEKNST